MIHFTVSNLVLLQRFTGLCSRIYVYVYLLKESNIIRQPVAKVTPKYNNLSRNNVLPKDQGDLDETKYIKSHT